MTIINNKKVKVNVPFTLFLEVIALFLGFGNVLPTYFQRVFQHFHSFLQQMNNVPQSVDAILSDWNIIKIQKWPKVWVSQLISFTSDVGLRRIWLLDRRAPWMIRRSSFANLRSDPYLLLWFFVFLERPVTSWTRWRRRDHGDFTVWLLLLPGLLLELDTYFREFRNRFWDKVRNRYFRRKLRLLGTWHR